MSSTPKIIIVIVVGTLALLSAIGVVSLSLTLFYKNYADPAVLTAFISITSGCIGSLASLLVNTRQPATSNGSTVSVTTTSEAEKAPVVTVEPQPIEPKP
jgi:hypothetical protein